MSLVEIKNDDGKNTPPLLPPPPLPPPPLCGSFLNGIFSREGGRGKRAFFPERAGERGLLERERTREIQSYRRHCKNCSLLFFPFLQEERWSGVKKKIKRGEREKKLALASFSLSLTLHQKKKKANSSFTLHRDGVPFRLPPSARHGGAPHGARHGCFRRPPPRPLGEARPGEKKKKGRKREEEKGVGQGRHQRRNEMLLCLSPPSV